MAMDWDDYQYFLAVATSGSVSAAARKLGQSHSTVIRRLDKLEGALDVRLFERFQSGYVLSATGEELLALLGPIDEGMQDVARKIGGRDAALQGSIRVTTTDTLLEALVLPAVSAFRLAYPGVHLQLAVDNRFVNLSRRDADVAIRPSNAPPDNLVGRKVGRLRTAPYAAQAYLDRRGEGGDGWDRYDWVAPDDALGHLRQAAWLRQHVPIEKQVLSVDSLLGMAGAVEAGVGAGMLLCLLAEGRRDLVQLAPPDLALDTELWILSHPDLRRVKRIRAFTDFLFQELSQHPGLADGDNS